MRQIDPSHSHRLWVLDIALQLDAKLKVTAFSAWSMQAAPLLLVQTEL